MPGPVWNSEIWQMPPMHRCRDFTTAHVTPDRPPTFRETSQMCSSRRKLNYDLEVTLDPSLRPSEMPLTAVYALAKSSERRRERS